MPSARKPSGVRYRKIDPRIWNDERVRAFTDDGTLAFLYLLTHPAMTAIGAMRGTVAGLAAERGWTLGRMTKALAPAIEAGMVIVNPGANYLGLRNFLKYNAPESPNVVRAWGGAVKALPECQERAAAIAQAQAYVEAMGEGFNVAFRQAFAQASGVALPEGPGQPSRQPKPYQRAASSEPLPPIPPVGASGKASTNDPARPPVGGLCLQRDRQAGREPGECAMSHQCPRYPACSTRVR